MTSIPPGLARERVWWIRSGASLTLQRTDRLGSLRAGVPGSALAGARPSRCGVISRWRRPNACAKRYAIRLRKQARPSGEPSSATDVIETDGSPHATTQVNGARSLVTLTAKPCAETPRETWIPIEAILRSPAHTPVYSRPSCERGRAVTPASASASTIAPSIVATNAGTSPTRMIG